MSLKEFFEKNPKVALGFSGGVDSAYLLYTAKKYNADIKAYYVKTQFQPDFEMRDAEKLIKEIGADFVIINYDILRHNNIKNNKKDRCYYCKNKIFEVIKEYAASDGYTTIIDGTNASDDIDDRPGMKAMYELGVKSPLKECGLTKSDIRRLSKKAGLFTWNKPAYACLATRIQLNDEITVDKLEKIEKSEDILFKMGFSDLRVRIYHSAAKLQFTEAQIEKAFHMRHEICIKLNCYFDDIFLDLKGR